MSDVKSLFASKTVWGAVIAILAGALSLFGYQLDAGDQAELINIASGIAATAGGLIAIFGRIVASKRIGSGR
jgi:CDP-diglyceride synthetase